MRFAHDQGLRPCMVLLRGTIMRFAHACLCEAQDHHPKAARAVCAALLRIEQAKLVKTEGFKSIPLFKIEDFNRLCAAKLRILLAQPQSRASPLHDH